MNKAVLNIIFLILISKVSFGQENLITNGSFEEIDSCYGNFAVLGFDVFQWAGCKGWSCPTYGSSDLWCDNPLIGNISPPMLSGAGYQFPKSGNSLAGVFTFLHLEEYREYLQNKLKHPLIKNRYYHLTIYVNNSFYDQSISTTTSCVQAYFSESPIVIPNSYLHIPKIPQIKNDSQNFITDTLGWQKIEGVFKANGSEEYVTIGCFEDDNTIKLTIEPPNNAIYFFIDDVSLVELPSQISFPNVFTPNDDGINDLFIPTIINVPNWEVFIYNRWGNLMIILNESNPIWDGYVNGKKASDGTYFYALKSKEKAFDENGFFSLFSNQ